MNKEIFNFIVTVDNSTLINGINNSTNNITLRVSITVKCYI